MNDDRLTIDAKTIEDNGDLRQVEFEGEAYDERYQFAVQYDVLEALSALPPEEDAVSIFKQYADEIGQAGLAALARDEDVEIVVITEEDLD